jgi:hypothetical protein
MNSPRKMNINFRLFKEFPQNLGYINIQNIKLEDIEKYLSRINDNNSYIRNEAYHYLHEVIKTISEGNHENYFRILYIIIISLITNDDIDEIDRIIIFLIICKNNNFAIYHYLLFETPFYFILNNIYNKISKLNSTKLDKKFRKELLASINYLLDISDIVNDSIKIFKNTNNKNTNNTNNKQPNNLKLNNIDEYLKLIDKYKKYLFNSANETSIVNLKKIIFALLDSNNESAIFYVIYLLTEIKEVRRHPMRPLLELDTKISSKLKSGKYPQYIHDYLKKEKYFEIKN